MTDLRALNDAFTELERRADAATPAEFVPRRAPRPGARLVPVAAGLAVVAGLVTGVALLAGGGDSGVQAGQQSTTSAQPPTEAPPFTVPSDPDELAERFEVVLGNTATFTVTDTGHAVDMTLPPAPTAGGAETDVRLAPAPDGATPDQPVPNEGTPNEGTPNGAAIVGTLTAADVTGGYDLQMYTVHPGTDAWCDDPDLTRCSVRDLPDGSSLAVGQHPLTGIENGVTYTVNLVRADGVEILMHVSNVRDPKGQSELLAPEPPLTTDQMVAIVTSDRW